MSLNGCVNKLGCWDELPASYHKLELHKFIDHTLAIHPIDMQKAAACCGWQCFHNLNAPFAKLK